MADSHPNHYDVLGIARNADAETIRRAYRQKMKAVHPDQFAGKLADAQASGDDTRIWAARREFERAEEASKRLNLAYDTLSDPVKRRRYDRTAWPEDPRRSPGNAPRPAGSYTRASHGPTRNAPGSPFAPNRVLPVALLIVLLGVWMFSLSRGDESEADSASDITQILQGPTSILPEATDAEGQALPTESVPDGEGGQAIAVDEDKTASSECILPEAVSNRDIDVQQYDVESLYKCGLGYLAQSNTGGDIYESVAEDYFLQIAFLDQTHAPVRRKLGEILFNRWQSSRSEYTRARASRYLLSYAALMGGNVDAEVQTMLNVLDAPG